MDEIISNLKNIALSGNDIYNACEKNIKILKYGQLRNFKNIDDAFDPYDAIALLYESKPNYGHWVLLLRHPKKKTIEFFDSYGIFPDDQIKKIPDEINKMVGQGFIYLTDLLVKSPYKIIYNSEPVQKMSTKISSCGRHLCLRYLLRNLPMNKYIEILKSDKFNDSDDIVTYLTAFI